MVRWVLVSWDQHHTGWNLVVQQCSSNSYQRSNQRVARAFSILEILVCITIVAILVSLLLPVLTRVRETGYSAVCASNLRQINMGFEGYLGDNRGIFPALAVDPEWNYGGVVFAGLDHHPVLDTARPINVYIGAFAQDTERPSAALHFRCPADAGITKRNDSSPRRSRSSTLANGTCFREFGTSYRANPLLFNSTLAGIDHQSRPLARQDLQVNESRLLLLADAGWWYRSPRASESDRQFEASWHLRPDAGNMLAADGSVHFVSFDPANEDAATAYTIEPRPR